MTGRPLISTKDCLRSGIGGAGLGLCLSGALVLDLRNRERTRCTVGWRETIVLASVDGVCGGFRRKSVRMSLWGCGSEMFPKEEPLWRRDALRPRRPMKQTLAAERSTPRRRPGKKPTSMAVTGNLLQDVAGELVSHATGVTEVAALLDVGVDMDAAEDAVGATSWLLLTEQSPAELQEYPNGQHKLPQVGSVAESAVVMSEISGFAVTFCEERSQGIALIVEQELPDGQQSTVVLAASTMQSDEGAQQKSDGSPA